MARIVLADLVVLDGGATWYSQPFDMSPDNTTRLEATAISTSAPGGPFVGLTFTFEISDDLQKWSTTTILAGGVIDEAPLSEVWDNPTAPGLNTRYAHLKVVNGEGSPSYRWMFSAVVNTFQATS